jgi:hypothetical protein
MELFPVGFMFLRRSVNAFSFIILAGFGMYLGITSFKNGNHIHDLVLETQSQLNQYYDVTHTPVKLKKFDLLLTDNGFIRYRKYLSSGKQEYYSFSLLRFKDLTYLGTTESGYLLLQTIDDDVIVQTYNDQKGNIDSMSRSLALPLKNIEPEVLQLIRENLLKIKRELHN